MSDSPLIKVIGFLNGLEYNDQNKNTHGHTAITQESITYLINYKCSKDELEDALNILEMENKIKILNEVSNCQPEVVGWLYGWIDPNLFR